VALVSLLLNTGLTLVLENSGRTPENTGNYDEIYATMAIQTSFLVGICYILMGVLKLGFVTIFLSHSVVSGFTSAAAIIIGLSQIKYVFGYDIPSDKSLHKMLINIFSNISEFNYKTFLLGTGCVTFLLCMKTIARRYPKHMWVRAAAPLVVTVVTIVLQATVDLESYGIPTVGKIPKGLPKFSGEQAVNIDDIGQLVVPVISIVIVGFMESIAIAKQLASKHNYEIDSSNELLGLGMANLMAGLFTGYPLTGSFSRSAVNNEAGAKSGISSIVTATLVGLVLLFMTPVFELLVSLVTNFDPN
jgi:MFS superfamily sulfate permease-like transporter